MLSGSLKSPPKRDETPVGLTGRRPLKQATCRRLQEKRFVLKLLLEQSFWLPGAPVRFGGPCSLLLCEHDLLDNQAAANAIRWE